MTCDEFLERYSDFVDEDSGSEDRALFEAHLARCASCARYHVVMLRGTSVLRENGSNPAFREDFRERLQHRLYLDEFESRRRFRQDSGSARVWVGGGLIAASVLLLVGTWQVVSDALIAPPTHTLPAIVASAPPRAILPADTRTRDRLPGARVPADLWLEGHDLLYEHSALYQRTRQGSMIRAGIQ